ncbi:hypothetical protein QUF72_05460 [Desulfobacterales bacterium HSG2]|nr:hypothetical protein [Desulfobacterales bacterium HSG2]
MIRIEKLSKYHKNIHALKEVSLRVAEGELFSHPGPTVPRVAEGELFACPEFCSV